MAKIKLIQLGLLFILPSLICSYATVGIEKAKYEIIDKDGKFEVRQYKPQILAETIVDSTFEKAGKIAFRRLFNFISGNNRTKESIAMTAPVNQKGTSETIKMTAPVNQQQYAGKYAVSFLIPSKYTMETLTEPLDTNVKLRTTPAYKVAAVRYSGLWSQKRYLEHRNLLDDFIKRKGLKIIGEDIFARYDPPFQLCFFRRNEVLFPVE
jgi:hypothetical protein